MEKPKQSARKLEEQSAEILQKEKKNLLENIKHKGKIKWYGG